MPSNVGDDADLEYNYVNFGTNYVAFYDGLIREDFLLSQTAHLVRLGVIRTFWFASHAVSKGPAQRRAFFFGR